MATARLKTWLAQRDSSLCWIEFEAYARRVFANDPPDWYRDPVRYAATLIQAQGVIPTQCLSVDVTAPFIAARDALGVSNLVELLGAPAPLEFISVALNALIHRFADRLDLVLKFTAPWDLLDGAKSAVGFDALDDVATALTACMRRFADRPLAGLLLESARTTTLSTDELDAYEPLISAARHYGWFTALALPADTSGAVDTVALDLDVLLWPQRSLEGLAGGRADPAIGGGLTAAVWQGTVRSEERRVGKECRL